MSMSRDFLLMRGGDLLVLGVRWSGFDLQRDTVSGQARLTATSDNARIVLTFPPQAIVEEKIDGFGAGRRDARLGGLSRASFAIPRGRSIELSAEGLLAGVALDGGATLSAPRGDGHDTAIEVPWHLTTAVAARSANVAVGVIQPSATLASPSGVLGLWHSRLQALDGDPHDARLALRPLAATEDAGLDTAPLSVAQRQAIVDESARALPNATRLELTALGGSLTARGIWPTFRWDHDASLGRDRNVRVEVEGVLYPFGHRAAFVQVADRQFTPPPTPFAAGPPAAAILQRTSMLVVTEPVRGPAQDDIRLARTFPFSEVEICARHFPDLESPTWTITHRHPFAPGALQEQLNTLLEQARPLAESMQTFLDSLPRTFPDYLDSDFNSAPAFRGAQEEAGRAAEEVGALEQRQAEINAELEHLDPETDQPTISALLAELSGIMREIPRARRARDAAQANADALFRTVSDEFAGLPRTFADLERQRDPTALEHAAIQQAIARARADIDAVAAAEQLPHNAFFTPHTRAAVPVRFPIRCAGVHGDVFFSVPLIFVEDVSLDATEHFPAFVSLTDPEIATQLQAAWAPHSHIPLSGARIDLVRGASTTPNDTHEVHELLLAGEPHGGAYRTTVTRATVELPSLRALVPGIASRVALEYVGEFAELGDALEVALKPARDQVIPVDFTNQPQRSGALVAPKFTVDAISRTLGPVTKAALPRAGGLPNLAAAYEGATLFGFPLSSLINRVDVPGGPAPPSIVPLLENGLPIGVRMAWQSLKLTSHEAFHTRPPSTTMTLSVERSREKTTTECTVSNFDLVLPPSGTTLLTLTFGSVAFTQRAGGDPDLKINGLTVNFAGSLQLLAALQQALAPMLGGASPTVRVLPSGISAGFALALPSVTAGAFVLRNVAVSIGIDVPFAKKPVTVSLGFARRENPFNLSVLVFGGGGYIEMQMGGSGVTRIEASLEFGAAVAVNFLIASGEVHALGGISFVKAATGEIEVGGFLRIGGSIEVLGVVSVSVELLVLLKYESIGNRLVGRATLVIEVDLTFISESVTIDSGVWVLAGGEEPQHGPEPITTGTADGDFDLAAWRHYREAFAS